MQPVISILAVSINVEMSSRRTALEHLPLTSSLTNATCSWCQWHLHGYGIHMHRGEGIT